MNRPGLSVVICAYTPQRWDDLRAAVESVHAQGPAVDELVVVIDHNEELLERAARELTGARVLPSDGPRGLSGARNTGWRAASGAVVAFLDDDAVAESGWAVHLLAPYADPDVLGVGGWAFPAWDTDPPRWFPEEFLWVLGCTYRGFPSGTATVRNLIGCNMSVRRDVLEVVDGFDTGLGRTADRPLGCEETELCIRATELFERGRFVSEERAVVHHRVRADRTRFRYFADRCRSEGTSKAWVSGRVGAGSALSSERSHTMKVLPAGVLRGLRDLLTGDAWGPLRSMAILAGLSITATSYLAENRRHDNVTTSAGTDAASDRPLRAMILDLCDPLDDLADPEGRLTAVRALVVARGRPIGVAEIDVPPEGLASDELAGELRRQLGASVDTLLGEAPTEPQHTKGPRPVDADCTVVVATRDRPESLERCLRSILGGVTVPAAIVVVDSAPSNDDTEKLVRRMSEMEPSLAYVRQVLPGLGLAHNTALPLVTTSKVLFTDDDVVVHPWWCKRLSEAFGSADDVVCVTGMIAPLELETATQRWIEANAGFNKGYRRQVFDRTHNHPDDALFPFAAGVLGSGANMAFRTEFLRTGGGFDAALGAGTVALGGDDLAAFYDAIARGHQLCYEPAAIVSHRHHRNPSDLQRQAYGYGAGLTAHLTRCALNDPASLFAMFRQAPRGLKRAAGIALRSTHSPSSGTAQKPANANGSHAGSAPRGLWVHNVRGMAAGPSRYLRSRRAAEASGAARLPVEPLAEENRVAS